VDAVNIGIKKQIFLGEKIDAYDYKDLNNFEELSDIQKKDIERFLWFSQGYVAINPRNANQILDIRYSNLPNQVGGLWGIEVKKNTSKHVKFINNRKVTIEEWGDFYKLVFNF
jgi:inner membrane protein